jgi:nucleoside-diphosphate-sugar epimerase
MKKALIGHTGFVGSNLLKQQSFDCCYNSGNIAEIDGQEFDQVICAGVSAVKWWANQNPATDREGIQNLVSHLTQVRAQQFILISTVDVYPEPVGVDESTAIELDSCHPYGRHRLELEQFVQDRFDASIIRLPGLFGDGLKKNIIYDFLNDNNLDQINPNGSFQFYYLDHLSSDIETTVANGIDLVNLATAPITVQEVAEICLGHQLERGDANPGASYDFKSRHAQAFAGQNGYLYSKEQVIADLTAFVSRQKLKV